MACLDVQEEYEEEIRFERAEKLAFSEINLREHQWFYWGGYGRDNGFFMEMRDLVEYCMECEIPQPIYVWATKPIVLEMDAKEIVEEALERKGLEERMHLIYPTDIERLQELLEQWCAEQSEELGGYEINYEMAIILGE